MVWRRLEDHAVVSHRRASRAVGMATVLYAKTSLLRTQRWPDETACTGIELRLLTLYSPAIYGKNGT